MTTLAGQVDGVIGVDTHRDTLTAAALSGVGGVLGQLVVTADAAGYQRLLDFACAQIPGRRCYAVEGAGSYGAGLTRLLVDRGEWVVEADRPKRPARRGGKSDALDAVRAAREALGRSGWLRRAGGGTGRRCGCCWLPPGSGDRADLRHQPAQGADRGRPEQLRAEPRQHSTSNQVGYCAALRDRPARSLEHRMTVRALRCTSQRIQLLAAEAAELEAEITKLVRAAAPWLLELPGMGPLSTAQVLVSWSHPGRVRSEAAFAALAGVSPIPASGQVTRHRLNRGGDRQLNRALHTVALVRLRDDPRTLSYAARRRADGKSGREIRRCIKRAIARQLFKLLERYDPAPTAACHRRVTNQEEIRDGRSPAARPGDRRPLRQRV